MDPLDDALGEIAASRRPTHQPSLDVLIASSRTRRHGTALVGGLGVAAVVAAAVVLVSGQGAPSQVVGPISSAPPSAEPCDYPTINGIADYVDFVHVHGETLTYGFGLTPYPTASTSDLGDVVETVSCRLGDSDGRGDSSHLRNGWSSYLAVGTPVYEVKGYDPACRVAARSEGKLRVYLAFDKDAKTATAAQCAQSKVKVDVVLQMVGGPAGTSADPVGGKVTFLFGSRGEVFTVTLGTATVEIVPGTYEVTGSSPLFDDNKGRCFADGHIVVPATGRITVTVNCHRK